MTITAGTAARALAKMAAATRFERLPEAVQDRAEILLLDTMAVLAGGGTEPNLAALAGSGWLVGDGGDATVLGTGATAPAVGAAIANGGCGNAQLLGEGYRKAGGHPAIHIVPAVFAAAERLAAAGPDLLAGIVVGYEVAARIGTALVRMAPGAHPNGNWGAIGAAAGVGYLAGKADAAVIESAIEAAAGLAVVGPREFGFQGVDSYHLLSGLGAGIGVTTGSMAALGWNAVPGTVEDYFAPRASGAFDAARWSELATESSDWPEYLVLRNYFKRYPTCAHTGAAIDAAADLAERESFRAADIRSVDIRCGVAAAAELDECRPPNLFGARYSMPTLCAVALLLGRQRVIALDESAIADPGVRMVSELTSIGHDPTLAKSYPDGRPTVVTVTKHDGDEVGACVASPLGESDHPMSVDDIHAKVDGLFARRYGASESLALRDAFGALRHGGAIGAVSALLRRPPVGTSCITEYSIR